VLQTFHGESMMENSKKNSKNVVKSSAPMF